MSRGINLLPQIAIPAEVRELITTGLALMKEILETNRLLQDVLRGQLAAQQRQQRVRVHR